MGTPYPLARPGIMGEREEVGAAEELLDSAEQGAMLDERMRAFKGILLAAGFSFPIWAALLWILL